MDQAIANQERQLESLVVQRYDRVDCLQARARFKEVLVGFRKSVEVMSNLADEGDGYGNR